MARSRKYELGVGCLLLGAMVVLAFMALEVGALSRLGRHVEVSARFENAAGLQPGAAVSVAGVKVGTVGDMRLDYDAAVVTLALDPDAHVGKHAKARIRARSVLGEKYVELLPGVRGEPDLADGDQIEVVGKQVEIDELVAMMGPLVESIDPERVGEISKQLGDKLKQDPELVSRMVDNADRILKNGADASDGLSDFVQDGRSTLAQTRTTLRDVDQRANESKQVLARADQVLSDVQAVSGDLPKIVEKVNVTLDDAHSFVGELDEDKGKISLILDNLSQIDKWELRRLLREEGILVRLAPHEVDPDAPPEYRRRGKVK